MQFLHYYLSSLDNNYMVTERQSGNEYLLSDSIDTSDHEYI